MDGDIMPRFRGYWMATKRSIAITVSNSILAVTAHTEVMVKDG
jgi:hypothetical protein